MARVTVALALERPAGCPSRSGLVSPQWDCWDRSFVSSSHQSASRPNGPLGGSKRLIPLAAPPTARSHLSFRESIRSPWEHKFSGWVSVSSSVGSHGTLDRLAGSTWVALLQPPACVVSAPPLAPTSGVGVDTTGCLPGTTELGVEVAGPSLPVCPRVATMISQFQSISLSPSNSGPIGVVPHWRRGCLAPGLLLLTGMRPEYPGRAPKARSCGVRWCVRVVVEVLGPLFGCLGGLSSVGSSPHLRLHVPGPRSIIFWTCLS